MTPLQQRRSCFWEGVSAKEADREKQAACKQESEGSTPFLFTMVLELN